MKYTVDVDDLTPREGAPCCVCPVARAIRRIPSLASARVGRRDIFVNDRYFVNDRFTIPLPKVVQVFIHRYDCGLDVQPFSFELEDDEVAEPEIAGRSF